MSAPRSPKRKGWPPNLYQQENGYFYWRNTIEKKNYGLGRDKAKAFSEARAGNALIANMSKSPLVARISGVEQHSLTQWLDKYITMWEEEAAPAPGTLATAKRYIERVKKCDFAWMPVAEVTTKHIADYLDLLEKDTVANNLRARLHDVFRMAETKGVIETGRNPVSATKPRDYDVKRERLSLEQFLRIREKVAPWAANGMTLALLTGQRIGDIVNMKFSDYKDGSLFVIQGKTGHKLQQDGRIRLEALGMSIDDAIKACRNRVISKYLIHHTRTSGKYKAGEAVSQSGLSDAFSTARDELKITAADGKTPPTFHEIRSLAERLYRKEYTAEFSQSIMGHKHAKMTAEYADLRGGGWAVVTVKQ